MFIDTHCHIHETDYPLDREEVITRAHVAGVTQMICVGTSEKSSRDALEFASVHDDIFTSIGVHPHDTKDGWDEIATLIQDRSTGPADASAPDFRPSTDAKSGAAPRVVTRNAHIVAIGEIGLDYFYNHSPRETQTEALEAQIQLALDYDVPIIFHVREAFEDFWPIFDNFHGIRGELHSFTDTAENMERALAHGLYIGVNGISTFTRDEAQKTMFQAIPLEKMLLETDAPFLTPVPFRGKVNEPAFVRQVAKFHANHREVSLEDLGRQTSANARALFAL